ncbi:DUF1302 domain-containing protein [Azohydromonas aeria]|uniref:DUF1302 domain-containing protein n=1 Tax=Azohydromonas aeria TaxID=2590212 RepID=UPI0012FCF9D6|nr:DUF1302 family protein [Azohydromonas aeria]
MNHVPCQGAGPQVPPVRPRALALAALIAIAGTPALAFEVDTGNPDLKVLWDTTLKYSSGYRLENPSQSIVGGQNYDPASPNYFPNTDDGSRNFKRGLVSNRLDVLSELDVSWRNLGFRISGAGWYDTVYQRDHNANDSPGTANPFSVPYNQFTDATRRLQGGYSEVLDAFVFGKFKFGDMSSTVRAGKHTVLYGESLFYGANGIAAAQASIDVIKAASVPNAQFKEFMMPVNQLSGQLQINPDVTVGGYYMLDWKPDRLPASGSYFSAMDSLATGGERLIVGSSPAGNVAFYRQGDLRAKKSGQFGLQMRFHVGEVDYGLYAVQWNDRGPSGLYLHPSAAPVASAAGLQIGNYQWAFHEGIRAVGGSFNTTLDNVNIAGEVSLRSNTPLDSDAQLDVAGANNSSNPLYAVGRSAHAQINWIASLGPSFLAREADFVGELAWNRRLSITKNAAALNPNATRDATNIRFVFEPKYRQVLPGLDLSVPVGVGYGIDGNSSVVGPFLGKGTGDVSIGINGAYLGDWRFGLNVTHYFGSAGPFIEAGHRTFKQAFADRDYLSFFLRRTF